jgi:hypothetical protein
MHISARGRMRDWAGDATSTGDKLEQLTKNMGAAANNRKSASSGRYRSSVDSCASNLASTLRV